MTWLVSLLGSDLLWTADLLRRMADQIQTQQLSNSNDASPCHGRGRSAQHHAQRTRHIHLLDLHAPWT